MTKTTYAPEVHHIFNELDAQGTAYGTPRIHNERNAEYKRRLLDIYVHPSSSSYLGLIYGITRELGLSINNALTIEAVVDAEGITIVPFPVITFQETKCYIYSDYTNGVLFDTLDRFDNTNSSFTLKGLSANINATGIFTCTISSDVSKWDRSMTIFNQSSLGIISSESLASNSSHIKLAHENLSSTTISVRSNLLTNRVNSLVGMTHDNDYYIDTVHGIVYTNTHPEPYASIRYEFHSNQIIFQNSPVIIHNLSSIDFKTKMFDQVEDEDGNTVNGMPTELGADIINELLTVFPTNFGK